jgi:Family of unknown function (DUF6807)
MIRVVKSVVAALSAAVLFSFQAHAAPNDGQGVQITKLPDRLRIEINGQLFTEYHFKDVPRPYFYPVLGPGELPMTRNWPMKDGYPNESHDHRHHRSLWFAHGSINGYDFWSEEKGYGKTVHDKFAEIESGPKMGVFKEHNNWIAADGTLVCTDDRTVRIYNPGTAPERVFDIEVTMHALDTDLTFGDTKEGTMAIRLAPTLRLKGKVGRGHIINSEGVRDGQTWGKRADWCDYYGPVDRKIVGVAIFDDPRNPRHPTWWHVRDYGLFAANPFGEHNFENLKDKTVGNLVVPAGKSLTLRYRFYFHEGNADQAKVGEKYQQYVESVSR